MLMPFRTRRAQEHVVRLLDTCNLISFQLHTTRLWSSAALDKLEGDLQSLLVQWSGLNNVAHSLGANASDGTPLVHFSGVEKIAVMNSIRRGIEELGACRFLSAAIGEKAHQGPKHCLELSKGKNKAANSLQQCQRVEYHDLRMVHTQDAMREAEQEQHIQAATKETEEDVREDDVARLLGPHQAPQRAPRNASRTGVVLRGPRDLDGAFPALTDKLAARICHLLREVVQKEVQDLDDGNADMRSLIKFLPPQPATPTGV